MRLGEGNVSSADLAAQLLMILDADGVIDVGADRVAPQVS
jgi:hypothetical protein